MRRHVFYLLVLLTFVACADDSSAPELDATVAGLTWSARVDTTGSSPQQLRVTLVGRNVTTESLRLLSTDCPVGFFLYQISASGKLVYDHRIPDAPNVGIYPPRLCQYAEREWTLQPGDTAALTTIISVAHVMADSLVDDVYSVVARAEFQVTNCAISKPTCGNYTTPPIAAGSITLRRQQQALPDVRMEDGLETRTWSEVTGPTVRVVVSYRNTTGAPLTIPFNTKQCGPPLTVHAYRDRAKRDEAYIHSADFTLGRTYPFCYTGLETVIPAAETRLKEFFFTIVEMREKGGAGTYYLAVELPTPSSSRLQSAGEVIVQ